MEHRKRELLEADGWTIGTVGEFLRLRPAEAAYVELKLVLARRLRLLRLERRLSQASLARALGSSQSRVAKMEAGDETVSADLLLRSLFVLGCTRRELGRAIGSHDRPKPRRRSARRTPSGRG
jgi:helix-turn-helix protein